jgi:hypothetical protein
MGKGTGGSENMAEMVWAVPALRRPPASVQDKQSSGLMSLARCGFETAAVWLRRSISECVDRQIKLMPDESFINVIGILSFWEYSARQAVRAFAGGEVVWLLLWLSEE